MGLEISLKLKHRHIFLLAVIAVFCIDLSAQVGIGAGSGPPPPPPSMIPANLHPATEESLRRYFEVTHFVVRDREGMIQQLEQQKKTLPPWFPPDLWTETSAAMLDIDVVEVAIPVYQRYYSEEGTQNAIKLFLTPQGQAMISKFHEKTMQDLAAGDPIAEARQKALAAIRDHEDAEIRQMMVSMTPKDEQQVLEFSRSPEWKRMNDLADQVYKAFNVAYIARQKEAAHAVAVRHQDEVNKAIRDYRASHPGYDPAATSPAK
jgi:hypothetical protein